jgi:hypothetical protein
MLYMNFTEYPFPEGECIEKREASEGAPYPLLLPETKPLF